MADAGSVDRNVAILMDFENTKDANLQRVLSHAAGYGQVIIRRAYADWTRFAYAQSRLREAGFEAVHQFTTGAGSKNSTDISLTVDAMDLLWSRPVDVFVLVTADSDFAKLAMRLREGGKLVVGMGAKGRVGRALVQACDHYIYYDEEGKKQGTRRRSKRSSEPKAKADGDAGDATIGPLHLIVLSSLEAAADDDGWVYGSPLHRSIRRIHPDFSYREHGHSTFRAFVESLTPVIHTETDPERSDFLVWIDDDYEDAAWAAVEAHQTGSDKVSSNGQIVLTEEVQARIDQAWEDLAKRGRVSTSKAGSAVAEEYGVDHLGDTPLGSIDGVLEAAPGLARKWRRERSVLVTKGR